MNNFHCCKVLVSFCLLAGGSLASPTNSSENNLLKVDSATIIDSSGENMTTIELLFDRPVTLSGEISAYGAKKVPIDQVAFGNSVLEDLNGDGVTDLVVADGLQIKCYINSGTSEEEAFDGDPIILVERTITSPVDPQKHLPLSHFESTVTFGDADNDDDRDIIVGEKWHGNVVFFPRTTSGGIGELAEYGEQRTLKWESATSGIIHNIAVANWDGEDSSYDLKTQVNGNLDLDLASAGLMKYDDDDQLDLIVIDGNPYHNVVPYYVEVAAYCFKRVDQPTGTPIYGEKEVIATYYLFPYWMTGSITLSIFDIDSKSGPDLVISQENGKLSAALNTGVRSQTGRMQFLPPITLISEGLRSDASRYSITPCAANNDSNINFVASQLDRSVPHRRRLSRFALSIPENHSSQELLVGRTLAANGSNPIKIENMGVGPYLNFRVADFNGDHKQDIIRINNDHTFSIAMSVDTGDDFNPDYADWVECVHESGEVARLSHLAKFSLLYRNGKTEPEAIIAITHNSGRIPKMYIMRLEGHALSGRAVIGYPDEIALPGGIANLESGSLSIALGDFDPNDGMAQSTGAYITRQGYSSSGAGSGLQIYWAQFDLSSVIDFSPAMQLWSSATEHNIMPSDPNVIDLDKDGDLDMVLFGWEGSTESGRIRWFENTASETSDPDLFYRGAIHDLDGEVIYTPGASPGIFCPFTHPKEAEVKVLSSLSKSPQNFRISANAEIYDLVYDSNSGQPRVNLATGKRALITQTPAIEIQQLSPNRVRMAAELNLAIGEQFAVNGIYVNGVKVSYSSVDLLGRDNDGDQLDYEWEIRNGLNPNKTDTDSNGTHDDLEKLFEDGLTNLEKSDLGLDVNADDISLATERIEYNYDGGVLDRVMYYTIQETEYDVDDNGNIENTASD